MSVAPTCASVGDLRGIRMNSEKASHLPRPITSCNEYSTGSKEISKGFERIFSSPNSHGPRCMKPVHEVDRDSNPILPGSLKKKYFSA
jgi:hypothetical protein